MTVHVILDHGWDSAREGARLISVHKTWESAVVAVNALLAEMDFGEDEIEWDRDLIGVPSDASVTDEDGDCYWVQILPREVLS